MAAFLEQLGSELSIFKADLMQADWNKMLHFCRTEFVSHNTNYDPTEEDDLLHDVMLKSLQRGRRPFCSYFAEKWIVALYGAPFNITEISKEGRGSIGYSYDGQLREYYETFTDMVDPWSGHISEISFDPENPKNERELFRQLLNRFGAKLANCTEPQADIATILNERDAAAFTAQRADFLFSFPNGSRLLLEPGDHDDARQITLDRRRDSAFEKIGIKTLRPRNSEIEASQLYEDLQRHLDETGASQYLARSKTRTAKQMAANYLFLLPSLVTRIERLLLQFFLRQGLLHKPEIRIGVIERDLQCAELSLASFFDRLSRLSTLYGIDNDLPEVQLFVQRNPDYNFGGIEQLDVSAQECDTFAGLALDLILDVAIKCNRLTATDFNIETLVGSVRQTSSHNRPVRFGYRAQTRPIGWNSGTEEVLNSFVQDFFRKYALRPGQGPILKNVLSQKSTIGLLPTSAGKSLCYQLAALLTPGTTLVVDPIVALMKDQVQSLTDQYGIDRVLAWHAGAGLHDENIAALLAENLIVFLSPERLLRPRFRLSMRALNAADIYINYAVIDEAHCVSMWGHDFRPSYLTLEKNFRDYCTFQGKTPVLVALTGTASQLVLIDLKRELGIQDLEAIIRPDTFNRPELHFNLVACPSTGKSEMLKQVMVAIARRLNVQQLDTDAHGIVFAYTVKELWELFGQYVGDAGNHVRTILNGSADADCHYGIYTGSPPKDLGFNNREWGNYKDRTLSLFKRGAIQMLFGNTAVSVGIDNEQLNYVINYKMPQSLEAYYQQCGRAGRAGQRSECYLIFSDDAPLDTQRWLNRETAHMPKRWDDLGTVAYFHQNSFPGQELDCVGALLVFKKLFGKPDQTGLVEVPAYLDRNMNRSQAERTERYLSYWLILGVLVDYEVTGMDRNTIFHVRRHEVVDQFLRDSNESSLTTHIVDSLQRYLSRYRPTARTDVEKGLESREETTLSGRSVGYLVGFIYDQIEYQRREAIRTMVSFCNETDTSPERLRARIRAYFDTSEKFSEGLLTMAESTSDFTTVAELLDRVDGFDDVEHLYWETRRLLDERFRPDWAAANLFAITYRERALGSDTFLRLFDDMVAGLMGEPQLANEDAMRFLATFLSYLLRLDSIFGEPLSAPLLAHSLGRMYEKHGLKYIGLIEAIDVPDSHRQFISIYVANIQLKEITHANYSRSTG